jgi:hypothetical protein
MDPQLWEVDAVEELAIHNYLKAKTGVSAVELQVQCWARLYLPNGQIAQTA